MRRPTAKKGTRDRTWQIAAGAGETGRRLLPMFGCERRRRLVCDEPDSSEDLAVRANEWNACARKPPLCGGFRAAFL